MVAAFAGVVILEFLPQRMSLPPDDRIFVRVVIGPLPEHLASNEVLIDSTRLSLQRQFADVAQKPLQSLRTFERGRSKYRLEFRINLRRRDRGIIEIYDVLRHLT